MEVAGHVFDCPGSFKSDRDVRSGAPCGQSSGLQFTVARRVSALSSSFRIPEHDAHSGDEMGGVDPMMIPRVSHCTRPLHDTWRKGQIRRRD